MSRLQLVIVLGIGALMCLEAGRYLEGHATVGARLFFIFCGAFIGYGTALVFSNEGWS